MDSLGLAVYRISPMAANLQPVSTKQFLVTIGGQSAKFTKATAATQSRGESEYNDGQTGIVRTHLDFIKTDKVTLSKPYDPKQDATLLTWYKEAFQKGTRFQVTIQVVNPDQEGTALAGAKTLVLTECQLQSFKHPDIDRQGSGVAMLEIVVVPEDVTIQ